MVFPRLAWRLTVFGTPMTKRSWCSKFEGSYFFFTASDDPPEKIPRPSSSPALYPAVRGDRLWITDLGKPMFLEDYDAVLTTRTFWEDES